MRNLLTWFVYVSFSIVILGLGVMFTDGSTSEDIFYGLWNLASLGIAVYLINTKDQ